MVTTTDASRYIRWFRDITLEDVPVVGGKNASLGEMHRELTERGRARAGRFRDHRRGLQRGAGRRRVYGIGSPGCCRASTAATSPRWRRRARRSDALVEAAVWPVELERAVVAGVRRARRGDAGRRSRSPCARARRPRTCPRRASPASRRPSSACTAPTRSCGVPAVLRVAVHRPGDRLSHRSRLRPPRRAPVHRRPAGWCARTSACPA